MASFNALPTGFKLHFRAFCIFIPKVSRVSHFSAENSELGFLQLIEGDF
jgi:hypothetical protein